MLYVQKYPRFLFIAPDRDAFPAHSTGHAFRQLGARHRVGCGRVPDEERVDRRGGIGGAVTDDNLFAGHVNCCFVPVPNRFLLAYGMLSSKNDEIVNSDWLIPLAIERGVNLLFFF